MKLRRILSIALTICMLLTLVPATPALANESESLEFEVLDSSEVKVELPKDGVSEDAAHLEQDIDEDEMVKVIIVMDGDSIVEQYGAAVLNAETQEEMDTMELAQAIVVATIEEDVLDGEELCMPETRAFPCFFNRHSPSGVLNFCCFPSNS